MKPRIYFRDRHWRVNPMPRGRFSMDHQRAWARTHVAVSALNTALYDPENDSPLALLVRETAKRADDLRKADYFEAKARYLREKATMLRVDDFDLWTAGLFETQAQQLLSKAAALREIHESSR
jgi:hypothetical protein